MATAPTVSEFRAVFPEFDAVDTAVVQAALDEAGLFVGASWPDNAYPIAYRLFAAHLLARGQEQAGGGVIQSVSLGSISISYARNSSAATAEMKQTNYGNRYLAIARSFFGGPIVVGGV